MPKVQLTDITVKALKIPESGQASYLDTKQAGFGVRVSQGGTKTFFVMHGKRRKRISIGRYPTISLSEARHEAKRILAEITLNKRPTVSNITVAEALALYKKLHIEQHNKLSTQKESWRLLRHHLHAHYQHKPLSDIDKQHISAVIDALLATPSEANHAFTAIRSFLRWALRRGYIPHNPMDAMVLPTKPVSRTRVLTDNELKHVWDAATEYGYPFGYIIKLLILTGQRRGEIAALRWSYIDVPNQTMTLPALHTKNNREHTFPYGPMVTELLSVRMADQDLLFKARGTEDNPFSGWGKSKERLDRMYTIEPWTLHDLRRTFSTNLAELGVAQAVTEKLLNHASGTVSGVAAIYNRYTYLDEMRDAIFRWERKLQMITIK